MDEEILSQLAELEGIQYALAQKDLGLFVQAAWDILEPETQLKWNWHHDLICEHLEATVAGEIKRLIINVAPRSTKSLITSVCFPDWVWTNNPATRFLFGSYADTLATKHSVLRRNLIESDWYQTGYGKRFRLSSDVNTKSEFTNSKTGQMKSAGIKGSVTGEGGDYIVIDDPHNPKGAESEQDRETTIQNFDLAWSSRLNDKKTGRIIVIMQRLHERDLTGHLLEKDLGYVHLKIPSIAEERETLVFPVSGKTVYREKGDLMHPERDGKEELAQAEKELGVYGFSGQHQQSPSPPTGGQFKEKMFELVDELPGAYDWSFIMADTAYKDGQHNDFTCFTAFGMKGADDMYILDVWMEQINADKIEEPAKKFINRFSSYGFRGAYIEPKGHGIYLNQALPKAGIIVPSPEDVKAFFSDRRISKIERANNAIPYLANRRIKVSSKIEGVTNLLAQAYKFPRGKHDDFVDTLIDGIKLAFSRPISTLDVL